MGKNKQITLTRVLSRVTDEWQTAGKLKATPYTMYKLEALGFVEHKSIYTLHVGRETLWRLKRTNAG